MGCPCFRASVPRKKVLHHREVGSKFFFYHLLRLAKLTQESEKKTHFFFSNSLFSKKNSLFLEKVTIGWTKNRHRNFFLKPECRACKTTNKKIKKKKKMFFETHFFIFFPKKIPKIPEKSRKSRKIPKIPKIPKNPEIQGCHMWTGGTRGLGGHTWTGGTRGLGGQSGHSRARWP